MMRLSARQRLSRPLRSLVSLWGAVVLLFAAAAPGAGQSLLSAYGFGTPMEPVDARALALGGIGLGLPGNALSGFDPTSGARLVLPAVVFTNQTTWNDVTSADEPSSSVASRFPSMGVLYPVRPVGTFSVSLSGVLDQTFRVEQERVIQSATTSTEARVTDIYDSDGGVSVLKVGLARPVTPNISVGVTAGTYIGNVTRVLTRRFDSLEVETSVPPFETRGDWAYSGLVMAAGVTADVGTVARLSGAVSLGGDLEATPGDDTEGSAVTVSMPVTYRFGATGILSDQLRLMAGLSYADWSDAGAGLPASSGTSVLRLGGGLEWGGASILGKPSQLRVGYRQNDLPFRRTGDPVVSESALLGGLGLDLLTQQNQVLARADLSVERGSRTAGSLEERFWRMAISIQISGL